VNDFEYEESDGGIIITKYNKDAPKDVIIPDFMKD